MSRQRTLRRWRVRVLFGVLLIPNSPAICSGELNPRANITTPLQLCPTPCDLTKVRRFVFLPPNYPLGEKMRRKCRLITESFPPGLCRESDCPVQLPNPCRTPATDDREEAAAGLLAVHYQATGPRYTGWAGGTTVPLHVRGDSQVICGLPSPSHTVLGRRAWLWPRVLAGRELFILYLPPQC